MGMDCIASNELKNTAETSTSMVTGLFNDADTKLMIYCLSLCKKISGWPVSAAFMNDSCKTSSSAIT